MGAADQEEDNYAQNQVRQYEQKRKGRRDCSEES